ncbi:MAG: hypothetical protein ACYTGG_13750 [Planctomycetota bacterium]|jgi:hypothetical protein
MPASTPTNPGDRPPARAILIGASNLTRGISTVVETVRRMLGSPVEILAALGHGRSYGLTSRVLARTVPGILECGLWDELARREPAARTCALVTDIGNDIMYGAEPETIAGWIDTCLGRLGGFEASVIVTRLPLGSIEDLGRFRFALARAVLYPARHLTLETARDHVRRVDALVRQISRERDVPVIEQQRSWYGFDPVHIRMRDWAPAWREILGNWPGTDSADGDLPRASPGRWVRLRTSMPQSYRMFGRPRTRAQPAAHLADGTTVSLY